MERRLRPMQDYFPFWGGLWGGGWGVVEMGGIGRPGVIWDCCSWWYGVYVGLLVVEMGECRVSGLGRRDVGGKSGFC